MTNAPQRNADKRSFLTDLNNENMRAKEFLDDYAVDDLDVFGRHEEHYSLDDLMEEYAKIYHEIEVKKFRLGDVVESLPQENYCKVCNLPTDGEKCYSKRCPV